MERQFEILIIDDDVALSINLRDIFRTEGYNITLAHDGQTAVDLCRDAAFDLALVDIKLPDTSGISLIDRFSELIPETPCIVITANASMDTAIEAVRQKRVVSYETKPVDPDRILALIEQIVARRQAEEALKHQEEYFRALIENSMDAFVILNIDGTVRYRSPSYESILGYNPDELVESLFERVHPDDVTVAAEMFSRVAQEPGGVVRVELHAKAKDGRWIPIEADGHNLIDNPAVGGIVVNFRDVSERNQAREELERSRNLLNKMESIANLGGWEFDPGSGGKLIWTQGMLRLNEFTLDHQPTIDDAYSIVHPGDVPVIDKALKEALKTGEGYDLEVRGITSKGKEIWIRTLCEVEKVNGEVVRFRGTAQDVTERKIMEEALRTQSITDDLTGLFNRRHYYKVLDQEIALTYRNEGYLSLVVVDLDGFKEYNDRVGHINGDRLLKVFAQVLKSALRKRDIVFRYAGDEFVVMMPSTKAENARGVVERAQKKWKQTMEVEFPDLENKVTFSTGIAQFPQNGETADTLMFLADSALFLSKRKGGSASTLVSELDSPSMEALGEARMEQVYALAATVDAKDPYTYGHSKRVAALAEKIAEASGLSQQDVLYLHSASLLHDIGKVGIPDKLLGKTGEPTMDEWELIKRHCSEGARIVGHVKGLAELVPLILHHHEWYDGSGYPSGLIGEQIPCGARILSIADAYDTMTTERQYRDAVSHQQAIEELKRCAGEVS